MPTSNIRVAAPSTSAIESPKNVLDRSSSDTESICAITCAWLRTAKTDARASSRGAGSWSSSSRVPPLHRDEVRHADLHGLGHDHPVEPVSRLRASVVRLSEAIGRSLGIQSWRCHCTLQLTGHTCSSASSAAR